MRKKYPKLKISSIFILILISLFFLSKNINAQEEGELTTVYHGLMINIPGSTELTFEYEGDPGQTFKGEFEGIHDFQDENKRVIYYPFASDFELDPETGEKIYPKDLTMDNEAYSLFNWFKFGVDKVELTKRGQKVTVPFEFTIPENAAPGSHYGVLLLSNITKQEYIEQKLNAQEENTFTGAGLASRLGPNIIITVSGDQKVAPEIDTFTALDLEYKKPWFFGIFEYPPVRLIANIKNNGNVFFVPSGNIFIYKKDITDPIESFTFNPKAGRVLPETNRKFEEIWDTGSIKFERIKKNGKPKIIVSIDWKRLFSDIKLGKYYATLKMMTKDETGKLQVTEKTVGFWIIPWKIILFILLLIGGYIGYKKFKKKDDQKKDKKKTTPKKKKKSKAKKSK